MDSAAHPTAPVVWAGSYTEEAGGTGAGVTPLRHMADGSLVVAGPAFALPSPTWLTAHPELPVLYAASESTGRVSAFGVSGDVTAAAPREPSLAPLGLSRAAGAAVCHLAVDPEGRFVVASCWGDGAVVLFPLDAEGALGEGVPAPAAADPHAGDESVAIDAHTGEPRTSRAHSALLLDATHLVTTDLGYDLLRFWRLDDTDGLRLVLEQELVLPPGSGPRHLAPLPEGRLLVITEYSIELIVVDRPHPDAPFRIVAAHDLLPEAPRPGESGSGIAVADDGRTVYLGIRGSDRIVPVRVQPDGSFDVLAPFASGGELPRAVAVDGLRLHVMHQGSGSVTSHALDGATGLPDGPPVQTPLASVTTLTFPSWSTARPGSAPTSPVPATEPAPARASVPGGAPHGLLTPEGEAFVTDYHLATLATLRTDGSPHQVPVGFTLEGRTVRIITSGTSQKVLNVRRGGRASVSQVERARWLSFEGPARILDDPDSVADAVRRYAARYREPRPNPQRVVIEITVERAMASSGLLLEP
ncbi:TIGR03618 family F420-dependent PPOX class oxidoreductase [Herbiconiux sp. YIM B11900]|uniref:TIGR03618 family F420-dependent PPOX class oxidoreductase n=1 Tax=Herbiconiux sp. YIM B11900 TaxID=3404131 RepID=UPI003F86649B